MGKSIIAGILLALSFAWTPAHATFFGDTTNNSAKAYGGNARAYGGDASAKSRSSAKAKASAKASAKQKQAQKQGQKQSQTGIQVQKGTVTGNNEGVTGNSVAIGGSTYKEAAQAGSVSNSVAYECGGTAGGYGSLAGVSLGGGSAFAFELCEDLFVARIAVGYGIEGSKDFLKAILDRRVSEFDARDSDPTIMVVNTRD